MQPLEQGTNLDRLNPNSWKRKLYDGRLGTCQPAAERSRNSRKQRKQNTEQAAKLHHVIPTEKQKMARLDSLPYYPVDAAGTPYALKGVKEYH